MLVFMRGVGRLAAARRQARGQMATIGLEDTVHGEVRVSRPVLLASILLGVWIVASILVDGRDVIIPIAIAVMIWQLINAIARGFAKFRIGSWRPSSTICRFAAIATIFGCCWGLVDIIASNVAQVSTAAPEYELNLRELLDGVSAVPGSEHIPTFQQITEKIDIASTIGTLSATLGGFVGNAGLVALYVAFLLLEQSVFDRKLAALFPNEKKRGKMQEALAEIEFRIEKYLWIKTVVSLLTAVLCYLVLFFVGVDYAVFWALIVFLLNFIPNIGSLVAVILPSILTVLQFGSPAMGLGVLAALSAVQLFVGNLVEPRLMGNSLNLSPFVIILSLTVWGAMWGVAGMFLCVPLTVIIMIILSHFEPTRPVAILLSGNGSVGR